MGREKELQMALNDLSTRLADAEESKNRAVELEMSLSSLQVEADLLRRQVAQSQPFSSRNAASAYEKQMEADMENLLRCLGEKEEARRRDLALWEMDKREKEELKKEVEILKSETVRQREVLTGAERQVAKQKQVIDILVNRNKKTCELLEEVEKRALMAESTLQALHAAEAKETSSHDTMSVSSDRGRSHWAKRQENLTKSGALSLSHQTAEILRNFEERVQAHNASMARKGEGRVQNQNALISSTPNNTLPSLKSFTRAQKVNRESVPSVVRQKDDGERNVSKGWSKGAITNLRVKEKD